MVQRVFLPNDVLDHTSFCLHSSSPAVGIFLSSSDRNHSAALSVLSSNSVFPQGRHKSCCFISYCHCSRRHVSALVPERERETRSLVPELAVLMTCSAPPASPSTPPACWHSSQSCFHLCSWCGEEVGLHKWGAVLSWVSLRGVVWLSLDPHWSCFGAEIGSVWKYLLNKETGPCKWGAELS